jgi:dienelactone hydrolase
MTDPASHDSPHPDASAPRSADLPLSAIDRRSMLQQTMLALIAAGWAPAARARADEAKTVPASWSDGRLGKLKTLNDDFPFEVPSSPEIWQRRAKELRRQVQLATGLWPMPQRPPIQATIHGKIERNDCVVERVFFESSPGLFVTGSLFRPAKSSGKAPIVLCPHGHWLHGRFYDHGEENIKKELQTGGEKFSKGGRFPLQARCFQLAKMGCVVFHYDMLGYADSAPITMDVAHLFKKQRSPLSQPDRWGLFSAQAELRLLSPLGIQTFHSVRALDFVLSLPDVDSSRIGVTGASGGGTQTFLLMAVDDRPTAAFPAVMVSTKMQGGCTCENASYLRVGTGNIELAALTAPRPLGMSAADDWTKELETLGLPELKKLYALMGVPDHVEGKYFPFPHNYNYPSRAMMYEFFNKHLALGAISPILEPDFDPLSQEELTVWNNEHPKPAMTEDAEVAVLAELAAASDRQMADLMPTTPEKMQAFRDIVGSAWQTMIARHPLGIEEVQFQGATPITDEGTTIRKGSILVPKFREQVPATLAQASGSTPQTVVIWIAPEGQSSIEENGSPRPVIRQIIGRGLGVIGVDLLHQGTHGAHLGAKSRAMENGREAACFVYGYNHSLFAQRVHDLISTIAYARQWAGPNGKIRLVGSTGAAAWVAAAAAVAGGNIEKIAVNTDGFRFAQITDIEDPDLLPGAVKYGDLPALLALAAPTPLWIHGESQQPSALPMLMYRTSQTPTRIEYDHDNDAGILERMANWIAS